MNDNRGGGFRIGKNTIEFKNQNRNNVNNPPQNQSGGKGFAPSGFNQRQTQNTEYESEMPVESLSFTNSKMSAVPQSMADRYSANLDYGQMDGSGGFVVKEPIKTQPRPILSQLRFTNAISILPPTAGRNRNRQGNNQLDEDDKAAANPPIGSSENIDHILDNMFTRRAPFQPQTRKSNSLSPDTKAGEGPSDAAQSNLTFDGKNKQLEFVDAGMGKMSIDAISKVDNATVQNGTVTDSTAS